MSVPSNSLDNSSMKEFNQNKQTNNTISFHASLTNSHGQRFEMSLSSLFGNTRFAQEDVDLVAQVVIHHPQASDACGQVFKWSFNYDCSMNWPSLLCVILQLECSSCLKLITPKLKDNHVYVHHLVPAFSNVYNLNWFEYVLKWFTDQKINISVNNSAYWYGWERDFYQGILGTGNLSLINWMHSHWSKECQFRDQYEYHGYDEFVRIQKHAAWLTFLRADTITVPLFNALILFHQCQHSLSLSYSFRILDSNYNYQVKNKLYDVFTWILDHQNVLLLKNNHFDVIHEIFDKFLGPNCFPYSEQMDTLLNIFQPLIHKQYCPEKHAYDISRFVLLFAAKHHNWVDCLMNLPGVPTHLKNQFESSFYYNHGYVADPRSNGVKYYSRTGSIDVNDHMVDTLIAFSFTYPELKLCFSRLTKCFFKEQMLLLLQAGFVFRPECQYLTQYQKIVLEKMLHVKTCLKYVVSQGLRWQITKFVFCECKNQ